MTLGLGLKNVQPVGHKEDFEMPGKSAADGKRQEIIVLDSKRSNAINIGLTVLPPPRTIKTAILNFDEYALNKEGIEKILTMIPTEEEKQKIQEAQLANPDIPLGSAEQFLLTLSSITELSARLQLWAFKMDYELVEKEVAEPLLDLKEGMDQLGNNKTLGFVLSTLLAIGNFLNGTNAKAFELSYLEKVPEVKDTVHKQSLLHHVCTIVVEKFPDSADLYSEIGAVTSRARRQLPGDHPAEFKGAPGNLAQQEDVQQEREGAMGEGLAGVTDREQAERPRDGEGAPVGRVGDRARTWLCAFNPWPGKPTGGGERNKENG
ncbi:UNVERIFIED_CONTAM: FH1/FH2 domain-containing protein 3 [Gekko kuhli]